MLTGKTAIVTGGSRGIGKAIAMELAQAGADVAIFYAGNLVAAEETTSAIQKAGRRALSLQIDVSKREQVENGIKKVHDFFGRIDILVNNAGIVRDNLLMRMKEEEWDQVIEVDLKSVFLCTKAIIRIMTKQRSGRIINLSSIVATKGNPGQSNYAAAKGGVVSFTRAVAKELAGRGITVNAVAPGFIETDMNASLGEEWKKQVLGMIPLGYAGTPEDVAKTVKFLASEDARYITGQVLHVDGGMVIY
jgi:3-oxoacyl-[acyl-carrier protein] reductase